MAENEDLKKEQVENGNLEKLVALQTIYIKDVSFEAPNSPGVFLETEVNPETKINLSNMHNKVGDNSYDVALKVKVESTYGEKTIFIAEVEQGGVFTIKGYTEEETKALIAPTEMPSGILIPGKYFLFSFSALVLERFVSSKEVKNTALPAL